MRNKRGNIPITILTIGTIVACCIALFSFTFSSDKVRNSFLGIELIERLNSQIENKTFYSEDPAGLYLETNISAGFFWSKQETLFSAEYKFSP